MHFVDDNDKYKYIIKHIDVLDNNDIINLFKSVMTVSIKKALFKRMLEYFNFDRFKIIIAGLDDNDKIICLDVLYNIPMYRYHYVETILSLENKELIIECFKKDNYLLRKILVVNSIDNMDMKIKLIELLNTYEFKIFILSNYDPYKSELLNRIRNGISDNMDKELDDTIGFGLEFEVFHNQIDFFENIKTVLSDFLVKEEYSVVSGLEISSPVLHYNINDMAKVESICAILNECNFKVNGECGGHIHIGIDYFKSSRELLFLLEMYCNCENILYRIINKKGTFPRHDIWLYAGKIKKVCNLAINMGDFDNYQEEDINVLIKKLKIIMHDRYKGLNVITNYPTIEFRIPNGEIHFKELHYNIRLILRMIQVSCRIANMNKDNDKYLDFVKLRDTISENDKLEILLSLLFGDEKDKNIYRERYYKNTRMLERNIKNKISLCYDKGINFTEKHKIKKR